MEDTTETGMDRLKAQSELLSLIRDNAPEILAALEPRQPAPTQRSRRRSCRRPRRWPDGSTTATSRPYRPECSDLTAWPTRGYR